MRKLPTMVWAVVATAAWGVPQVASATTCDEILARVGQGDSMSALLAQVRAGPIDQATVQCLIDRHAPAQVIAAARAMLAPLAKPVAEPVEVPQVRTATPTAPSPVDAPAAAPESPRPSPSRSPAPKPVAAATPSASAPRVSAHRPPVSESAAMPSAPSPAYYPPPPPAPPPPADEPWVGHGDPGTTESYTDYGVNPFTRTDQDRMSTFAIDVDNGSYTMTRRKLNEGYLPPESAVRAEEFVNYLTYQYPRPTGQDPFAVNAEMARSPWHDTWTVAIGVQGRKVDTETRKPVHLTFLVDTSGSMQSPDKLGLVKQSLTMLTNHLKDGDTVALVVYAGSAGLVLPATPMSHRADVLAALSRLEAGGSTAMGQGIQLAYQQADRVYADNAVNRVIIASDGDANVGATDPGTLSSMIQGYAKKGITLTTLGFGEGNYRDTTMEQIADDGDGNYFYIDSEHEAQRVLVDRMTSTLEVIAKDVKIQVEFDPSTVKAYRLIGYENRDVADKDFRNDQVDGGEIGAGHQVTALYEVEWTGEPGALGKVHVRNKAPGPDAPAVERQYTLTPKPEDLEASSPQFRMALAAGSFAEVLRASNYAEDVSLDEVLHLAKGAARIEYPEDKELVGLIYQAMKLRGETGSAATR